MRIGIGLPDIPGISDIAGIFGIGGEESTLPLGPASPVLPVMRPKPKAQKPAPRRPRKPRGKRKPVRKPVRSQQGKQPPRVSVPDIPGIDVGNYIVPPPQAAGGSGRGGRRGQSRDPYAGIDPRTGAIIPLGAAQRGARPMTQSEMNALVASLVGNQYTRQTDLISQERDRMEGQNRQNLERLRGWYDQVLGSQGVAAQRDEAFGRAAVESATDATTAIISALGGEANQGSYVAGAAGQENIGNLQAIGTIQNEYNADIAPLLQAEAAGSLAREQALGSSRSRDLALRLSEMQSERGSAEADLRFKLWQANNEILDRRLQNELSIRQMNAGTRQQNFNNRLGLMQGRMAYEAAAQQGLLDAQDQSFDQWAKQQGLALDAATIDQRGRMNAQDNATRAAIAQAQEAGRNYRAKLAGRKSGSGGQKDILRLASSANGREGFMEAIFQSIPENAPMNQAMQIAIAVTRGMGLPVKNAAVQGLLRQALYEAGYDVN